MIFESDEESGSADIRRYIDKLKDKIGLYLKNHSIRQG